MSPDDAIKDDVIEALGGLKAVAALTGTSPKNIRHWPRLGIPPKHWLALVGRARETGRNITFDGLAEMNRRLAASGLLLDRKARKTGKEAAARGASGAEAA